MDYTDTEYFSNEKIKEYLQNIETFSEELKYEDANKELLGIRNELDKPRKPKKISFEDLIGKSQTKSELDIKFAWEFIIGNNVRLNPEYYPFSKIFGLTLSVQERIKDIKNPFIYSNITYIRKIVAEEMVRHGMTISPRYRGIKPNRAFLDIALTVKPSICAGEIERRETVKLWKAVESGNKKEIEKQKKKLREIRRRKYYE